MNKKNKRILPYLEEFLLSMQANGYSDKTIYNYERDLDILLNFIVENNTGFNSFSKKDVLNFKAYLSSRDRKTSDNKKTEKVLSEYSINRILSSFRMYLRFLDEMDYKTPISPSYIKLVKTPKKHPHVPELRDLVRMLEVPTLYESNKFVAIRNHAMLETLFATGMRISELINLKKEQIDGSGKIFIRGKGKKERFVYLTPRAIGVLNQYIKHRTSDHEYLFIPLRGENSSNKHKPISKNYLQEKIKKYREFLKINVPITAHTFRHGFATYLAEYGANPAAIQVLLGHESLDTTTRYVNASDRYAEKIHHKFHPLKKEKKSKKNVE